MNRLVALTERPGAEQPLFLDFVNTLHWDDGEPIELIGDRAGLAEWLAEQSLPAEAADTADAWLPILWPLREHMREIVSALVAGHPPPAVDLAAVQQVMAGPSGRLVLVTHSDGRSEVAFQSDGDARAAVTCQIALSLAGFLATGDRSRLKLCANPGCGFAFLDTSMNRSRRWCDMRYCGNRLKARAFRRRRRTAPSTVAPMAISDGAAPV